MKIGTFHFTENKWLTIAGQEVREGDSLLFPDPVAAEMALKYRRWVTLSDVDPYYRKYDGHDLTGKSLLLFRYGGWGDLLFLTPLLRYLDTRYPGHGGLVVACGRQYESIYAHNPHVRRVLTYPVRLSEFERHDYHLFFEGTLETSADPDLHAVDLFARHAGVGDVGDRRLDFAVPEADAAKAKNILRNELLFQKNDPRPLVGIHVHASSPVRNYPPDRTLALARELVAAGCLVLLLGSARDRAEADSAYKEGPPLMDLYNLCGRFKTMALTAAIVARLDLLVGPDSSLVHVAGALDVPTVALYGPFPGAVRTRYYPRCVTLEGEAPCAPCFTHGHDPCPKAGADGASPCLLTLESPAIARVVLDTLARHTRRPGLSLPEVAAVAA